MDIGTQIRVMRAARGVSQRELARLAGIAGRELSLIETGKMLPTPELRDKIERALRWPAQADVAFAILEGEAAA